MAGQRSSFGKLQRDRDKQAKAAAKRARRQQGTDEQPEAPPAPASGGAPTEVVLERLAEVHRQFDAGEISYDQFEEAKADLLGRLSVE